MWRFRPVEIRERVAHVGARLWQSCHDRTLGPSASSAPTGSGEACVTGFLIELTRMCHLDLDAVTVGVTFGQQVAAHRVVVCTGLREEFNGARHVLCGALSAQVLQAEIDATCGVTLGTSLRKELMGTSPILGDALTFAMEVAEPGAGGGDSLLARLGQAGDGSRDIFGPAFTANHHQRRLFTSAGQGVTAMFTEERAGPREVLRGGDQEFGQTHTPWRMVWNTASFSETLRHRQVTRHSNPMLVMPAQAAAAGRMTHLAAVLEQFCSADHVLDQVIAASQHSGEGKAAAGFAVAAGVFVVLHGAGDVASEAFTEVIEGGGA